MAGKRKEKKLSDCMKKLLQLSVTDEDGAAFLAKFGVNKADCDNRMLVMARLLEKAIHGDTSAIREVRSVMSETENTDRGILAEILEAVKNVV